jgi:hypothetical protein
MKYFLTLCILAGCSHAPSNEMEDMTRDVLKAKRGIEIQVFPMEKDQPVKKK